MTDYDYAAVSEPTVSSVSRKPIRKDDRSPWSPKHSGNKKTPNRKNKTNQKKRNGTKQQKQLNKRQANVMRAARRADAFDNSEDNKDGTDAAGQQNLNQLLGLGKPRPLLPPASQLKPFVSVGVCSQNENKSNKSPFKKKTGVKKRSSKLSSVSHISHTPRGGRANQIEGIGHDVQCTKQILLSGL